MERDDPTRDHLINKLLNKCLNVRAAAMSIALLLAAAGCWMIFIGIKDQGMIDIKTPFITGQAKSGFVGVLLVFAVVVITVVTQMVARSAASPANQKITVRNGDMQIEWEGRLTHWNEANCVGDLLKTVQNALAKTNNAQD